MLGLYDHQGVLRFAGTSRSECLAYAELFGLAADSFTLESVEKVGGPERMAAATPGSATPALIS